MELDDFKANWKNAGRHTKSPSELQLMTRIDKHPRLQRIRRKLLIEIILLSAFLLVYQDIFDASEKPLWANACLIAGGGLFVLNDLAAFFILQNPVRGGNLVESVRNFRRRLQFLMVSSLSTSFLFGASLILFFSVVVEFTNTRYLLLAGMLVSFLVFTYWSYKSWWYRVRHIKQAMDDFREEGGKDHR